MLPEDGTAGRRPTLARRGRPSRPRIHARLGLPGARARAVGRIRERSRSVRSRRPPGHGAAHGRLARRRRRARSGDVSSGRDGGRRPLGRGPRVGAARWRARLASTGPAVATAEHEGAAIAHASSGQPRCVPFAVGAATARRLRSPGPDAGDAHDRRRVGSGCGGDVSARWRGRRRRGRRTRLGRGWLCVPDGHGPRAGADRRRGVRRRDPSSARPWPRASRAARGAVVSPRPPRGNGLVVARAGAGDDALGRPAGRRVALRPRGRAGGLRRGARLRERASRAGRGRRDRARSASRSGNGRARHAVSSAGARDRARRRDAAARAHHRLDWADRPASARAERSTGGTARARDVLGRRLRARRSAAAVTRGR